VCFHAHIRPFGFGFARPSTCGRVSTVYNPLVVCDRRAKCSGEIASGGGRYTHVSKLKHTRITVHTSHEMLLVIHVSEARGGPGNTGSTETSLLAPASHLGKLETVWGGKCPALSESDFQPASPAAAYRRGARVARGSVAGRVATDGGLLLRGDEVVELLAGGRGLRRRLAASHQHIRTAGRVAQHQHLRRESAIRARRARRVRRVRRVQRVQRVRRVQHGRAPRRRGTWR